MPDIQLHTYFRSSASYRVRIALNLKGVDYPQIPVHLLRNGGEQLGEMYRFVYPDGLLPALADSGDPPLAQSLAIIEYLEERFPEPPLLPAASWDRAYVSERGLHALRIPRHHQVCQQRQRAGYCNHLVAVVRAQARSCRCTSHAAADEPIRRG